MRNLNKPNRYNVASIQAQQTLGGDVMESDENGQYVTWRDYAWLLAEVERLTNCKSEADRFKAENARLKAEVERLRKAGDAMAEAFPSPNFPREHYAIRAWNAAKEGKQS